jgi:hypothetical protein
MDLPFYLTSIPARRFLKIFICKQKLLNFLHYPYPAAKEKLVIVQRPGGYILSEFRESNEESYTKTRREAHGICMTTDVRMIHVPMNYLGRNRTREASPSQGRSFL